MQVNSWYNKLFHFHLSFWIWKVWKGKEKIIKIWIEYLENEKSFLDEIKNIFYSFQGAIIWWKNKNLIKIADTNFKYRRYSWFPFVENTISNSQKVTWAKFPEAIDSFCFISINKFDSFKNLFCNDY